MAAMQPVEPRPPWYSGQGLWAEVPAADWDDWHWQLRHRLTTLADLEALENGRGIFI
jgi:lysine 2,3-aminomutase